MEKKAMIFFAKSGGFTTWVNANYVVFIVNSTFILGAYCVKKYPSVKIGIILSCSIE
ncbi:hypothetical protein ACQKII_08170 [Lysinibacillus sp. NPDC048646]|uniref:hypothetical protein n=1 Tax=Lysinibacillus sp. NPDC048646 TaxID=3390574 RepID=UPI003D03D9B1